MKQLIKLELRVPRTPDNGHVSGHGHGHVSAPDDRPLYAPLRGTTPCGSPTGRPEPRPASTGNLFFDALERALGHKPARRESPRPVVDLDLAAIEQRVLAAGAFDHVNAFALEHLGLPFSLDPSDEPIVDPQSDAYKLELHRASNSIARPYIRDCVVVGGSCERPRACDAERRCEFGAMLRNTDVEPIDNSDEADDEPARVTLTVWQKVDGSLRAELAAWPSDPDQDVPLRVHWGPLDKLAGAIRRHGFTAAGLARAMVRSGVAFKSIRSATQALA